MRVLVWNPFIRWVHFLRFAEWRWWEENIFKMFPSNGDWFVSCFKSFNIIVEHGLITGKCHEWNTATFTHRSGPDVLGKSSKKIRTPKLGPCLTRKNSTAWWFQPLWKICSSNWGSFPQIGLKHVEHNKCLKPPPRSWLFSNQRRWIFLGISDRTSLDNTSRDLGKPIWKPRRAGLTNDFHHCEAFGQKKRWQNLYNTCKSQALLDRLGGHIHVLHV